VDLEKSRIFFIFWILFIWSEVCWYTRHKRCKKYFWDGL